MTSIGSINGVFGIAAASGGGTDPRQAALGSIGEIGHRVLAWVGVSGGTGDAAAWTAATGSSSDFRADANQLARGGDIYRLGDIASELSARFGGTPAQEGGLRRSLEGFTREAVVQLAGLSGGDADRQIAGLRDALTAAGVAGAAGGIDGVAERLDAATASLAAQNNG